METVAAAAGCCTICGDPAGPDAPVCSAASHPICLGCFEAFAASEASLLRRCKNFGLLCCPADSWSVAANRTACTHPHFHTQRNIY